ncbi:MAG: hypothetical protein JSV52_07375 [Candidatus Zixiibacteriota bacterium]|nr:MAG: hypothetical protein JSV52_07375 [candidate division Zixibacteria bacterium]
MLFSRKTLLIMILTVIAGSVLLFSVSYTDACRLQEVTLNEQPIRSWEGKLALNAEKSIVRQPVDSLAGTLIAAPDIYKVDVSYELPGRIEIKTNNFEPVCFLVDAGSGELFGLTEQARVVSLQHSEFDWEHPVLTSVMAGPAYGYCHDVRVGVVVEQLERLRNVNVVLYRLISEIDFGQKSYVLVSLSGLPYRLKVRVESFREDMLEFVEFVSRFAPDLEGVTTIDMRFENMIICGRKS